MTHLRYIAEQANELVRMAYRHGSPFLAYLMEMAAAQAEREAREDAEAKEGEPCLA